ncbi:MAG: hypothetical protein ACK6BZ_09060 [Candidatus Kapaibacterium sp.]|jgi:hypothetical protein|nr:hypothetical protein [Candidatus Kapabacteria bacterium]
MHFNFVASDHFDLSVLNSINTFVDHFPDFQTVWLTDENELTLLLELMGIHALVGQELKNTEFSKYWDLSSFRLPELNSQQFDEFYEIWVAKSRRDNNMDEYGNLIFLQGLSAKWNKLKYRLIIKEGR